MATEVGQAYVTLIPSAKGFASKMQREVAGEVAKAGRSAGDDYGDAFNREASATLKSKATGMFKGMALAAGGALAAAGVGTFLRDSIAGARESAQVTARTENVIKSMGNASKISATQVADLAEALSNKTGMDDEAIQAGENLLLTFGNVRNEAGKGNNIFTQTTGLMVDMSRAMGTDTKGAAIQLGKALNDPVKGVSALSRVGVSFSKQQTKQIKKLQESGKTLEAQKIVLGEVKKQFGGAGKAMATPAERAKIAFGNFQEDLGTLLLPALDKVLTKASDILPAVSDFATMLADKLGPAISDALGAAEDLFGFLSDHQTEVKVLTAIFAGLVAITYAHAAAMWLSTNSIKAWVMQTKIIQAVTKAWAAVQWLLNIAMSANPIGLIIIAVAALVALVVFIIKKFHLWDDITRALGASWQWLKDTFGAVWKAIKTGTVKGVTAVVTFVKGLPGKLWNALKSLGGKLANVFKSAWNAAKRAVANGIAAVVAYVKGLPGRLLALGGAFASAGRAIIGAFVNGLKNAAGIITGIAGNVWDALRGLLNGAIDTLNDLLEFSIKVGPKTFTINPPDIGHLANGGRVTGGTLAVIGEGREPETVLPDSMLRGLLERTAAARGTVGELTITNWEQGTGYFRLVASGEVQADHRFRRHLGAMNA
jgi:hypothetical protein